jgi:small subunit ribosomal protein S17
MAERTEQKPAAGRRVILWQGTVVSDKMDKTISVRFDRRVLHEKYHKYVSRNTIAKAHDPENQARTGDVVEVEFSRPLSKTKRWRLVRVVKAAPVHVVGQVGDGSGEAGS